MGRVADEINAELKRMEDAAISDTIAKYNSDNARIIIMALKKYTREHIKPILINILKQIAQRIVYKIDGAFMPWSSSKDGTLPHGGNEDFPVWFGQMHDATGVAIYDEGRIMQYLPTKKALDTQPQSYEGIKGIIGHSYLTQAMQEGSKTFSDGLYMVLFCAVPYAAKIEAVASSWGRGQNFFTTIADNMFEDILVGIDTLKPY